MCGGKIISIHVSVIIITQAAQCYLHIAGLVAEYMKVAGKIHTTMVAGNN